MQYCTACQKALATIHILDLREGSIVNQQHLCPGCAEQQGVVQQKVSPLKLPPEMLEDLFGAASKPASEPKRKVKEGPACPGCGLTAAEFKMRGRLGCPRCYQQFRAALLPLLERVHDATNHCGRFPGRTSAKPKRKPAADPVADLRTRLADAIKTEQYEAAARLRDQIKQAEEPGA